MPELPDLQVFSQSLTKVLKDRKLIKINVIQDKKLNVTVKELTKALEGQQLTGVERSGKQLHFKFTNGQTLGLHLMLHGQMHWFENHNTNKFTILELYFEGDRGLAITDFQRQVTPTLNPADATAPDALAHDADYSFWKNTLQKRNGSVKSILLNQDVIRGIGNAYADEILYDARLSPFSTASKIPDTHIKALARSVRKVLQNAEKQILKNDPDRISGEFREFLQVHSPKLKATAEGKAIHQKELSSRKTYYTDEQEVFD